MYVDVFEDADYEAYLSLLAEWGKKIGVELWAYCLMPDHVHLIAFLSEEDSLAHGIGATNRCYTRHIITGRSGKDICGRAGLLPLDEAHLLAAVRYVVVAFDKSESYCYVITAYRPGMENFEKDIKTRRKS